MGNLVGILSDENKSLKESLEITQKELKNLQLEMKNIKSELGLYQFEKLEAILCEIRRLKEFNKIK